MASFTHDRIKLDSGILTKTGVLWGNNALQSITINRNTPRNPVQGVGYLGIVDYTSGVITSDLTLDAILVESCVKADTTDKNNSIYKYAAQDVVIGTESYVLTSFSSAWQAGSPATLNFGFLTPTIASHLAIQDQPEPEQGEESRFAVVLGDDGSGIILVPTWDGGSPPATAGTVGVVAADGSLTTISDNGLAAGVQSINFNATVNRDNVLDVRSAQPAQFVTTYPLDMGMTMEVYCPPSAIALGESGFKTAWDKLLDLNIQSRGIAKHPSAHPAGFAGIADNGDSFIKVIGLRKTSESESVSVGQYLSFSAQFTAADLILPLPTIS